MSEGLRQASIKGVLLGCYLGNNILVRLEFALFEAIQNRDELPAPRIFFSEHAQKWVVGCVNPCGDSHEGTRMCHDCADEGRSNLREACV
jgi:hypothetical protein